jgi:hypothetical protein
MGHITFDEELEAIFLETSYKIVSKNIDKNGELWYNMRIYRAELRRWVKTQNTKFWYRNETIIDYSINEHLFTLLALK